MEERKWSSPRRKKTERDKFMTEPELKALLLAAKKIGREAYALIAVNLNLGLRISELVSLRRENFANIAEGAVRIKSLKQKSEEVVDIIYVDEETVKFISGYIAELPERQDWLFKGNGEAHMTRFTAWRIFCRALKKAKLNEIYTPHALRHSRGVNLWESTHDLQYVRSQLRHRSINSTSIYIHMSPDTQRKITEKVKPTF